MRFSITQIWDFLLEMVFPRGSVVRDLEKMTYRETLGKLPSCGTIEDKIFAVFQYRNTLVRQIIWELKYKGNKKVVRLCAEVLYQNLIKELNKKEIILIPIPLTLARRRERGFNQNELVIEEIVKIDASKNFSSLFDALVKTRNTVPQSSIKNRGERLKNLNGCFAVPHSELVRGKNIILIDDVVTTGSTLKEARAVLLRAGALSVRAITIAH